MSNAQSTDAYTPGPSVDDGAITKKRARPRWGVKAAAEAYCQCGWHGIVWYGRGCHRNANDELHNHRVRCQQGELKK